MSTPLASDLYFAQQHWPAPPLQTVLCYFIAVLEEAISLRSAHGESECLSCQSTFDQISEGMSALEAYVSFIPF